MGLGGILILLLLIVSLIVFIYIIVMTARNWGVLHTILLCTLFIECWVFMVFSAGVQSLRVKYTRDAKVAMEQAEREAERTKVLQYGTFSEGKLEAVVPVKGMLRRLTADRGRVWRQLSMLQSNNGEYLLQMASLDSGVADASDLIEGGAAAPAAPATSESLPANLVVYAFAEELTETGIPKPIFYLGEFVVTQSQAGQVSLKPTLPLLDSQNQRIASGNAASWMLYELLPIDSHEAFVEEGSEPSNEAAFGRMDPEVIQGLFTGISDGMREKVIDAYVRDGLRATPNDEPKSIWLQLKILASSDIDVDSTEEANATVGGYFDSIGRSVDTRLQREGKKPVTMSEEMNRELIIFKEDNVTDRPLIKQLLDGNKAEILQRLYVRPLNDYEEAFNRLFVRSHELGERITLVQRESAEISKANQLGTEMIGFRQVENQKLAFDLENYQKEIAVLTAATESASQELDALKKRMSGLYQSIQTRRTQL
jgi:hypothetical protein